MRIAALVLAGVVLAGVAAVYAARGRLEQVLSTPRDPSGAEKMVVVPEGADVADLFGRLEAAGLVTENPLLDLWARALHDGAELVPGEYRVGPSMSPVRLLAQVERGRVYEHAVPIPAGSTLEEVAARLEEAEIMDAGAFLEAARDPELARRLGVEGPSVEGFIFPDVWALPRGLDPEALVTRLVTRFFDEAPNLERAAMRLGLTVHQLVTIASLVERGPVPASERRLYAALLLERLQKGYALESAAADAYGRTRPGAPADPRDDPWNTTARPGLPATPIGSPGLGALRAAAEPADTEPVFMVRVGAGRHVFCPDVPCYLRALRDHAPGQRPDLPKRFGLGARR
jgi:UPF0755 protein